MIRINVEEEKCVDCGACIAVCSSQALSLDRVIWSLVYDEQKCTGCKSCIKACPLRAIKAAAEIPSQAADY
ncbi:MAG TPA: 4Fe-4S binding protein [Thermoanaerobacterales bacterium]|jgi:NAD-dependent dihydropyrimidine dehydrogenase PreA subunit|nr:4Fe-4S binding protein [Thermoanaerobacterales bacterium]